MPKQTKTRAQELDQYFTSLSLARRIVDWAGVTSGMRVLEPSAGGGVFEKVIPQSVNLTMVELDGELAQSLRNSAVDAFAKRNPKSRGSRLIVQGDFAKIPVGVYLARKGRRKPFDLAVMNPPYSRGLDGIHIARALELCDRVVALVRTNVEHGSRRFDRVWRKSRIQNKVVLVNRPVFGGPADDGIGARSDHIVIELVPREEPWKRGTSEVMGLEWWDEKWSAN